ncbi:MAG: 16S rRNA (guanine(527)-N(7))-methyltransferase RsmG [bacterium]|nr:MAG: 16S rRNA (guanine(527)-N(7))-methyltransferase RsmG [bacterium]
MDREQFIRHISSGAAGMGVELDGQALDRLFLYFAELQRWNRKINLVSRQEPDWIRVHFLDSLAPLGMGLLGGQERVVDLGAGAGFPGVPLKIASPGIFLGMAEASGRKCAWLRHLSRALDMEGTRVLEGRFERILDEGWRGRFDLAVSRAAAKPSKILKAAQPFLAPQGRLLVYTTEPLVEKGRGRIHPYTVPGSKVPSVIWELRFQHPQTAGP